MVTIAECFRELECRKDSLKEAEDCHWGDVIAERRDNVREMEDALHEALMNNAEKLIAVAGDLELGELFDVFISKPYEENNAAAPKR